MEGLGSSPILKRNRNRSVKPERVIVGAKLAVQAPVFTAPTVKTPIIIFAFFLLAQEDSGPLAQSVEQAAVNR